MPHPARPMIAPAAALAAALAVAAAAAAAALRPGDAVAHPPAAAVPAPCPYDALSRLLAAARDAHDIDSALADERDTLAVCIARARIWAELLEAEARISAMTAPAAPPPPPPDEVVRITEAVAPEPAPAATAPPPAPAPETRWFTMFGVKGSLRAGLTDGRDIWFVVEGDSVPGGARVASIRSSPAAVTLSDGTRLPWLGRAPRPAPPGRPPSAAPPATPAAAPPPFAGGWRAAPVMGAPSWQQERERAKTA